MRLIQVGLLLVVFCMPFAAAVSPRPAAQARRKTLPAPPRNAYEGYEVPFRTFERHKISSGFGWRRHPVLGFGRPHRGVDFAEPYGTPVYPSRGGEVVFAGWRGAYGQVIEIRHKDGGSTVYGHLARSFVKTGEQVSKDKLIGVVGSSGLSTGPHLHFEYRSATGIAFDPLSFLRKRA